MFVTANQFSVFIACLSIGGTCGVFFSVSALLKNVVKNNKIAWVFDLVAFIFTSLIYGVSSYKLCFPNYRVYMTVGVLVGIFLYLKSFHILLAKTTKKIYNIMENKIAKVRNDRIKNKKVDSSGDGRCGASHSDTFNDYGLSTNIGECGEKAH